MSDVVEINVLRLELSTANGTIESLSEKIDKLEKVVDAVKSLNLDKVEGYMILGKSYKEIILEALAELNNEK